MLAYLSTGDYAADALHLLEQWGAEYGDDEQIAGSIYTARMMGRMGGGLFVRTIEVPESVPSRHALDAPGLAFLSLPFDEAIREFLARRIVSPDAFAAMSEAERLRSFTATRLASQQMIARAKELLEQTLREGGTMRDFIALLDDGNALGITPANPAYLETVYRTNVQSSYGQGRLEQIEDPAVVEARPIVQYRTAGDSRVRPRHARLNGVQFDRSNDPGWRQFAPPIGFSCRCAISTVRPSRIDRARIVSSADLVREGLGADPGFSGPGSSIAG